MAGKQDQLIIIIIAVGVLLLLPKLTGLMRPPGAAQGGSLATGESGGGYYANGGEDYGIPWNLLQQTPNTGYVGMDPPTPDPEPEPVFIDPGPIEEGGDLWSALWEGLVWGAGFVGGEELIRRTFKNLDNLKRTPPPPGGGTTDPAPAPEPYSMTPAITPDPHEAPGIWDPMYAEGITAAGIAAVATAAAYKLAQAPIVTGIASRVPSVSGGIFITPEMLGAPAGTNMKNIKSYLDQWQAGINQAKTGHPLIGLKTALIGSTTPQPQHHGGNIATIPNPRVTQTGHDKTTVQSRHGPTVKKSRTITLSESRKRTSKQIRGY